MRIKQIQEMMAEINADPLTMSQESINKSAAHHVSISQEHRTNISRGHLTSARKKIAQKVIAEKLKEHYKDPKVKERQSKALRKSARLTDAEKVLYKQGLELLKKPRAKLRPICRQLGISSHILFWFEKGKHLEDLE
jgi:predicted DNA-binding protein (UPF0251 family)